MKKKLSHKEFLIENLGQHVVDHAIKIYGKGEDLFKENKKEINSVCVKAFAELSLKNSKKS